MAIPTGPVAGASASAAAVANAPDRRSYASVPAGYDRQPATEPRPCEGTSLIVTRRVLDRTLLEPASSVFAAAGRRGRAGLHLLGRDLCWRQPVSQSAKCVDGVMSARLLTSTL